ncbi:GNAT family N-acetyltransferase [Flavobacterium sp. ASW18X]|uniref:GNAT family N-acetyltransferase n=1 Tax=Flavobacterium sp. ASW18X TaxID=2572595 RepID=UPI0010AE215F|nr:GNAT family N-acetyltransferase [Flavobacterium sp. ASW18X]TKD59234.1 GNAT family N-acetyltransferase [Flavobacterium sp. ASW18X]
MENVILRDAKLEDLVILKQFEQELIAAERPFDSTIKPDPISYYNLEAYIKREDVKVVVAEVEGQIVSSGYALSKKARHYLDHEAYAYLGFMYTLPAFRGKALNAQIMHELKAWAKMQGLLELRLTVYQENSPAVNAYKKSGFASHINEMRLRLKED